MRLEFLALVVVVAITVSSCTTAPNAACNVAAGSVHVPIEGNAAVVSQTDFAAAMRTLGRRPIHDIYILDHGNIYVNGGKIVIRRFSDGWRWHFANGDDFISN